ncbi:MAG: hypothetical protein QOF67_96 [Mycobacterium sp.]|jgi:hypothetical protein|nr:hypothetical protein [Mycobacterium sp.]
MFASAGLLTTGLLVAGASAGTVVADTGDSAGGTEGASVTSKVDGGSEGESGATKPDPPTSTVGSGRDDADVKSADEDNEKNGFPTDSKKFKGSNTVPIPRIPGKDELPASGVHKPCLLYTTLVLPVLTLADVFARQPQPEPPPAPSPAFRTQEEGPPVADSSGGRVDAKSSGGAGEPPVLQAPLVIAPLPMLLPPAVAPVASPGASAGIAPPPVAVEAVAVGANAPVIRGAQQAPTLESPAETLTPMSGRTMSGQATRFGYPRYLRTPTAGELAAVALPGVAGLMFLTFSGGCIGYRQANSVRFLRAQDAERFLR